MSSNIIQNSNIENINEEKNNSIDTFSKNFNNCFNKMRYSKKLNDNNTKIDSTNNIKNNIIPNRNNNNQTNSLMEYEFLYSDSNNKNMNSKQNTKLNKEKESRNKINNNNSNNKKYKNNKKYYHNTYNKSINKGRNNTFNLLKKKIISIKSELNQNKDEYGKSLKNNKLKRNLSQKNTLEIFLKNMKDHQIKKEEKINNIRKKTLEKEVSEMKIRPEISEGSLLLLKNIKRKPLYQKTPLNEEEKLDTNFKYFYSKNVDFDNKKNNSLLNSKTIDEKYNKFYESNIKWKKDLEEKNNNKRNNNIEFHEIIENCSFKPKLDKNSINIVDKLVRNKTINYEINNSIYDPENEKEMIDKLRIKLKPILNEYYNNNTANYISKKSAFLIRNNSDINIRKKTYYNYNYKKKQNINNKNIKMNYKRNEQKYKINKKEEKKKVEDNKKKKSNLEKKGKDYYLSLKIRQLQKEKADKKKELYKLNIRQGTAWNMETINNIIPKQKCGHIIEGLL